MIKKQNMLVITFKTTTQAMAMEACCKEKHMPGRLIPLPKSISAGCGMAWSVLPEYENQIMSLMRENNMSYQEARICLI